MRPALIVLLMVLSAGACGTLEGHDVPGCHGPRRPANPHGSILSPGAETTSPSPAAELGPSGCGRTP